MTHRTFRLPLRLINAANTREHWATKARRARAERQAVALTVDVPSDIAGAISVTFTRVAPRKFDDDGLAISCKAIRDEVARLLGRDDAPGSGVSWLYRQQRGRPHEYAVDVEILWGAVDAPATEACS